jgi:hypothetical protein
VARLQAALKVLNYSAASQNDLRINTAEGLEMTAPRLMRAPRGPSPEERELLELHRADADYRQLRHRLTLLFGRATEVLVKEPGRKGTQTLTQAELGLLNDVLIYDEAMVIE